MRIGEVAASKPACFVRSSSSSNLRGPIVPTGRGKSTARIGCATGMPGWRGEELLRLLNDVELRLRSSARLFLPAKGSDLSGANREMVGGSRRGGEHRRK